jgi:hypothetical protein
MQMEQFYFNTATTIGATGIAKGNYTVVIKSISNIVFTIMKTFWLFYSIFITLIR